MINRSCLKCLKLKRSQNKLLFFQAFKMEKLLLFGILLKMVSVCLGQDVHFGISQSRSNAAIPIPRINGVRE